MEEFFDSRQHGRCRRRVDDFGTGTYEFIWCGVRHWHRAVACITASGQLEPQSRFFRNINAPEPRFATSRCIYSKPFVDEKLRIFDQLRFILREPLSTISPAS